ncbi:MAG: hypothetical protein LBF59_10325 [Prevotellaceae bacterium]|jgi:YD repeat-containing protein|nr:hypothetical protein [Prevotellaceae bacterium]
MKKQTFFTIALCCCGFMSWSQFDNKLSELGLKGKVSSLVEREYQLTNYDYNTKKEERKVTFLFNTNGFKTEEKYTNPAGETLYLGTLKYAPSGELVEEKVNNYEQKKDFVKKYVTEAKEITVNLAVESETPSIHEKYTLDLKNNVTQKLEYDRGEVIRTFKYSYNSAGKLQSETQQMPGLNINFRYTYNNKGQLTKKSEVNAAGKVLHTQSYTYDANGNIVAEVTSYTNDPQELRLTYKYVLDSAGNWTEKQEFMDGRLFSVITREISYY